jgi:hypothetical protein
MAATITKACALARLMLCGKPKWTLEGLHSPWRVFVSKRALGCETRKNAQEGRVTTDTDQHERWGWQEAAAHEKWAGGG